MDRNDIKLTDAEILNRIAERFDPDEICDMLGVTSSELVESQASLALDNLHQFCDIFTDMDYVEEFLERDVPW